jgi:hypothetical protein
MSHKDIFRHRYIREAGNVLIDRGDSLGLGVERSPDICGLTVNQKIPPVGSVYTRDNLDKRGLPRAVFPHERMDFSFLQGEVYIVKRPDTGEKF